MALKYWYKAANGSDNWAVAGNWYNGSGGTGGLAGVPTAADDVIIDAASGSGTITIAANATCLSINFTGFTGTLAGTFNLSFLGSITLSSSMTLTYSGTATLGNGTSYFTSNGKTVTFNITVNNVNAVLIPNDNFTMSPTATLTLTSGVIQPSNLSYPMSVGLFVSTGSVDRSISVLDMSVTGSGTIWNVTGNNFSWNDGNFVNITNTSASTKTITSTPTTASASYGGTFRVSFLISGAGTGSYVATGNFYDFYCHNTGGASINFGTTTMFQNFDWGLFAPVGVTPNMNWNNGASTMTFNSDYGAIYFNSGMTITASSSIAIANPTASQAFYLSNQYNKSFTSTITISGSSSTGITVTSGNLITTSSITLTNGTIDTSGADIYCSSLSTSNANIRTILTNDLYLTGTGTLVSASTTTNLTVSINNIRVAGSSSVARTLSPNAVFYPLNAVYLGGTGGSTITLGGSTVGTFDVYVTNTGGASISFSTGTIKSLEFSSGTNAIWANAASQTLTITGSYLTIAASAGTPTLTPNLIFNAIYSLDVFVTLNGKSLRTGTVVINDSASFSLLSNIQFDGFSSNAAFTATSAGTIYFAGPFSGTSFTSTACGASTFASSLILTGTLTLANSLITYNDVIVLGNLSVATILHSSFGGISLYGPTNNVTTSITLNNTNPAYFYNYGTLTTPTFTITNGFLASFATLNVTGTLTLSTGTILITGSYNYNLGAFASSGSGVRDISMGNGTWTLTGTGTVWNLVATNLTFDSGLSTINITNSSGSSVTFTGGGRTYYTLQLNRGATGSNTIAGSNTFINFIDIGTAAHSILFTQGTTQTIGNFVVNGSAGNLITIDSVNSSGTHTLVKSPSGVVNCDYLNIQHSIATPSTETWYAGTNSVNNQAISTAGSGWIFTNMPPRKLGVGGVG
jgi:hypothetical protein